MSNRGRPSPPNTDQAIGRPARGFLARLKRAEAGNVLPIMAMALIPIAGMVGSGLDMSRAYMAKAKLQNACDSAALAARREMSGGAFSVDEDGNGIPDSREEGTRFFDFNFPEGTMGAPPVDLTIDRSAADASVVEVTAATTVPTTIMRLFGRAQIPIEVACDADKDYVHNDIMVVLDVTLSMNCRLGSPPGTLCTSQQTNSRIARLRTAGMSLYDALAGADQVRTRFGFMPYSLTVNVSGRDRLNNWILPRVSGSNRPSWLREPARYRSGSSPYSLVQATTHNSTWFSVDRTSTSRWHGCVEERSSIGRNDASNNPQIASAVTQADIDTVSTTTAARQFQPYDATAQGAESDANTSALASFCPRPATRLHQYTGANARADYQADFTGALQSVGGWTFHDVGMMWGMRFLSSSGMFAGQNATELALGSGPLIPVQKHIVFFTDGALEVSQTTYSAYGVHQRDNRMVTAPTTGTGTDQARRHKEHFLSACNRARQMDMTVWVISLDVTATDDIEPCASGPDHFFVSDGTDLDDIFDLIGKGIGRLRLTS